MKYIGEGSYIHGVPARDLTPAEYRRHRKAIREAEETSGVKLYATEEEAEVTQEATPDEGEG